MYWFTEPNDQFIDVFSSNGDNQFELFKVGSEKLFNLYHKLNESDPLQVLFTNKQKVRFQGFFSKLKAQLTHLIHTDLEATINRMGIIMFRMSIVLTMLRNMDEDFNMAENLVEELINNAHQTLELLPNQVDDEASDSKRAVYVELQEEFSTAEAKKVALKWHLCDRTVDRFLKSDCFEKVGHGRYKKVE